ncbi:AMP-binding protein [Xylophilus sp. GOD-11R]|uniref:oxidoreductase n=1 Tax=Xylophilus sp. GOD-11R TaxID=3089814 RepID=UPI00298C8CE3|nr:AMP-binding protein [Xylophilus sp. GOD-11R]WPB58371.1 AMP-binding protein [Xylophilus sp. GOD-11R]
MTSALFSGFDLRGLHLNNRVVASPMWQYIGEHGRPVDRHLVNLGRLAEGGAGLVIQEGTLIERRGCGTTGDIGIWSDEQVPGLRRLAEVIRAGGSVPAIQLMHSGRKARQKPPHLGRGPLERSDAIADWDEWEPVAPSAIAVSPGFPVPRAMDLADIATVLDAWAAAARRAREAGYEAIDLHGGHGYLIAQFLSPVANQRTDAYGGDFAHRIRFLMETVEAIRSEWPADKPLLLRLSTVDHGWSLDDSVALARLLHPAGVDLIDCSSGGIGGSPLTAGAQAAPGYQVPYAAHIRRHAGMPTMAVGLIVQARQAEAIVADGHADLVALGRELIHNPHWPIDAAQKLGADPHFAVAGDRAGFWLRRRAATVPGLRASTFTDAPEPLPISDPTVPMEHTLHAMLAQGDPQAACLRFDGRDIPRAEFRHRVERLAGGLSAIGIGRGDVVAIWLPNTPDWIAVLFACARVGATVLSLNPRFGAYEIGNFVRRSRCVALFYAPEHRGKAAAPILEQLKPDERATLRALVALDGPGALPALGDGVAHHRLSALEASAPFDGPGGQPDDPCIILSSSGTTSEPKLIVHSQRRIVRHAADIVRRFAVQADTSRLVLAIPCCGAFGFTVLITAMQGAAPLSVVENFAPAECAALLREHRITHLFGTNDQLDKMLAVVPPDWNLPDLLLFGHANFTPGLPDLPAQAAARGIRMNGCFGLTETMALFATQPFDASLDRRAQSGGIPLCPTAAVRVRSLDTGELLPPGQTGELELFTPDLMLGYLHDEAATRKALSEDGWFRTGDLAYLTEDGGFIHLSRIGDVLRIGGYLVNPLEIEEAVLIDPAVQACQVVEVQAEGSVRPVGFVIGKPGYRHDEAALIAACRARLAIYKVPIRVFEVERFPTTPSPNGEKVRKNEMRDMAAQRLAMQENAR